MIKDRRMYLWNPKGVLVKLLGGEIEKIIGIDIQYQPDRNNHGKRDKPHAVINRRKQKGDQEHPESDVICRSNEGQGMSAALLDGSFITRIFSDPREPRGCMHLDHNSIQYPND